MAKLNALLDSALSCARRGWSVFPIHSIKDGHCDCLKGEKCTNPGKHPRTANGFKGATTDPRMIEKWWDMWPTSNVGVATGKRSGIVVLDVDDGGEDSLIGKSIPDTVEQITGSGGRHIIFSHPDMDKSYKSSVKFLPGLDSRADGGYIIVPPSNHKSGKNYEWEASSLPGETELAAPPDWFVEAITKDVAKGASGVVPEWNPDGKLPENIIEMLSHIPSDDYERWRDVGLALHFTDPSAEGLTVWDWWSGRSDKYDGDSVQKEWANFSRRGHQYGGPVITLSSVKLWAKEAGWDDPLLKAGKVSGEALLETFHVEQKTRQKEILEEIIDGSNRKSIDITPPQQLCPTSGLIKDIVDYILQTSRFPQPALAVGAAVCYLGALMGRKYQGHTGLCTNLYIVGLAESGMGKDHARKIINKLASNSNTLDYLGGEGIASGPGLLSAIALHPSQLFMIDEYGHFLKVITGGRAPGHKAEIVSTMLKLYSSAGNVYRGTEYANQKDRPRVDIDNPNLCIYGTTVPDVFWNALTSQEGVDGTLARTIIIKGESKRTRQRANLEEWPQDLLNSLTALAEYSINQGNLDQAAGGRMGMNPHIVSMNAKVEQAWEELEDEMTGLMTDRTTNAIYSRVPENAYKLALVYAISQSISKPVIDEPAFIWAREFALWTANLMVQQIEFNVADSDSGKYYKRILNWIREAGKKGITRTELGRKNNGNIQKREFEQVIKLLITDERIIGIVVDNGGNVGRKRIVYYDAKFPVALNDKDEVLNGL